jgi:beta-fructofuranosidase
MPWHPRNKYCWDSWFFQQGSTLHAFYLQASQFACRYLPDKRHGLASIGHAILTDFGWKEVDPDQPALEKNGQQGWDDLVTWTGSIIQKDEVYYLFYTGKSKDAPLINTPQERRPPQNIGVTTSSDLHTWKRTPASLRAPVIPNPGVGSQFDGCNWRDPQIMKDRDGKYYAFICARPQNSPPDQGGLIAYAVSEDLENWQTEDYRILYQSDEYYLTETPQVFWRRTNDGEAWRLYLLFGPHWSPFFIQEIPIGVTCYVRSIPIQDRSQVSYDCIPWEDEKANILCKYLYAGKLINPETANFPLFYGFQKEDEAGHFVGGISDPQWASFADDGTISLSKVKAR